MAQFTVTINDVFVPRIELAYGLTGTAAEKKATLEAWVKTQIKNFVENSEAARADGDKRQQVRAEIW